MLTTIKRTSSKKDEMTDSELDLLYQSQHPSYLNLSDGEPELSIGSVPVLPDCPPGLEFLCSTNALYLKPYSGPLIIGHVSSMKKFEVLDVNGKRIFLIRNAKDTGRRWSIVDDDEAPDYTLNFIVYNHTEDEVFQYFGTPGKVGPNGSILPWGHVTRTLGQTCCCLSTTRKLHFNVITEEHGYGSADEDKKSLKKPKEKSTEKMYSIDGTLQNSIFPVNPTKIYYSTFDCELSSTQNTLIGQMSSSLFNERLGISLPGMLFPEDMNVYDKAVLFGALLIDISLE